MQPTDDDDGDGLAEARQALRALLDSTCADKRRELALVVGEASLELAHEGDTELARALGMSLTLLSAAIAHVAALESELVALVTHHQQQIDSATERGIASVRESVHEVGVGVRELSTRVERLEHACPGLPHCESGT